jgi:hypothetical protein
MPVGGPHLTPLASRRIVQIPDPVQGVLHLLRVDAGRGQHDQRLSVGEKRALQAVTKLDYKFSLSRIRSIH